VGDHFAARLLRILDGELGDDDAAERAAERIASLVVGVRKDGLPQVLGRKLLLRVVDVGLDRTELKGLLLDLLKVVGDLANVEGQADDLRLVLVLDPLEHHRRVETSGVEEQALLKLALLGLVARHLHVRRLLLHGESAQRLCN
jgi:hypothetical protein